jgi:hypothetical protein
MPGWRAAAHCPAGPGADSTARYDSLVRRREQCDPLAGDRDLERGVKTDECAVAPEPHHQLAETAAAVTVVEANAHAVRTAESIEVRVARACEIVLGDEFQRADPTIFPEVVFDSLSLGGNRQ